MNLPRPRISLLTSVLPMTIVAMVVALWHTGNKVVPLRNQIRNFRRELGYYKVDDRTKIHAQRSKSPAANLWKWRLFLPNDKYSIHICLAELPDLDPLTKSQWLDLVRQKRHSHRPLRTDGEFTLDLSLEEYDDKWWCRYGFLNEIQSTFELRPSENWFAYLLKFTEYSEAAIEQVANFSADEPVILLHVRRGIIKQYEGDWAVKNLSVLPKVWSFGLRISKRQPASYASLGI